ncbi:hypothetical protein [Maridesulfovibrio sp.]|uniref:hypothetical protein n=1 Tax=Maridesulfovibrio sp. TaxID=2795000 RepID=UPI003B00EFC9
MDFSGYGFDMHVRQHPAIPAKPSTAGNRAGTPAIPGFRTMEASFLGVACDNLSALAVLKSLLQSFIHRQMRKDVISFGMGYGQCKVQRRQKNDEKYLYFALEQDGVVVQEQYLNYQGVACLQVGIDKAIALLPIEEVCQKNSN